MRIRARSTCRRVLSAVGCAVSITALPVAAQSIAVLHSFATQEQLPHGLIQASDGNFYGTTSYGGANGLGSVFKVTPTGTLTTLYSFRGVDGSFPQAHDLVQGVDGNLYGTTSRGGPGDDGTVFKITPEGILATLHSFNGVDGSFPNANLVQGTDGNFYGTTAFGGDRSISVNGYGTVFSIAPTGALTTLHSFSWGDGAIPGTGLVQGTDGRFYGTTSLGGANGHGTFFRMEPDGMLTTLRSFAVDAELPNDGLVKGADGSFYGTTTDRVFKITPTGTLTTIVFGLGPPGGNQSEGGIALGSDGDLYGTTSAGGDNVAGTVFKVTPDGLLTVLHSFAYDDGAFPRAGLVQGTDGSFYGTTTQGGTGGSGTVFKITPSGALTTLLSFAGSEGSDPYAGLLQGTDGHFYGTTTQGGTGGSGTVFKITPSGALTTLHSFTGSDGANPHAGLVQGTDGDFYGTTRFGGTNSFGTVFKITPLGALTTLHRFTHQDGAGPYAGLVQGTDGHFYGTTTGGGDFKFPRGTVFKITPSGALTTLHSFTRSEGANPWAGLVQGTDGDFYGTTYRGGASGFGTVFRITPAGALTTISSFAGSNGRYPYAGLVQGTDGNLYGTTNMGGTSDYGTAFKITPAGALTTLHSFAYASDGAYPYANLVQGTDGSFSGTTYQGGTGGGYGTVFRITPAGTLATQEMFRFVDGAYPRGGLVQGADGNFYGTTSRGGAGRGGIAFRLTPGPAPSPTVTSVSPASGPVWGGTVVTISGSDFQPGATVTFGGTAATTVKDFSMTTIYALAPVHAAGAVTVTVTNPDSQSGSRASAFTYACLLTTPLFAAPLTVEAGSPNRTASVPLHAGSTYLWTIENGTITAGQGTSQITFTAGVGGTPLTLSVTEQNACGSVSGNATITVTAGSAVFLPVVLDNVAGLGGSHYTTELTLASKATTAIQINLLYTASVGSGTGTVSVTLGPGETRIIPNTVAFLRSQGLSIPTSGSVIGTLLATFDSSSSAPFIGARTFTTAGGGTFGLFYPAAASTTTTATLVGLQQNDAQRSNLALVNTGGTPITLHVQLFGPMGEDLGTLLGQSLPPYGWTQINQPLDGKAASGRAVVSETAGTSPFTAYAVLNDAVTSDGSFIPPLIAGVPGPGDRLLPIVLDVYGLGGTHYTTELTLANLTSSPLPVTFVYRASLGSGSGLATLTLAPGQQRIVPDAIGFLRLQGLAIPNDGSSVGGSLLALLPSGTAPSAFAVGARTFTPASSGGGAFGLYYSGLTLGELATSVAYVNGLQQNDAQRSNLAAVNRGDASDSITLKVSYFDGAGVALGTPTTVTLAPGQWTQFNQPLQVLSATCGFAKIEKTSGNSRFVAYGVLNDAVTSDGSFIPMSF